MINLQLAQQVNVREIPHNSVCFTGHREINGVYMGYQFNDDWTRLHKTLHLWIHHMYHKGWCHYVVGGALGVDMLAGIIVEWMIRSGEYPDMRLYLAVPHVNYNNKWQQGGIDEVRLNRIMVAASVAVLNTQLHFKTYMLFKRNEWMVDKTTVTCAVYDNRGKGGTMHCRNYAIEQGRQVCTINPTELDNTGKLVQQWNKEVKYV